MTARDYIDTLASKGVAWFTLQSFAEGQQVSAEAARRALGRLKKQRRVISIYPEFFVIVPPDYRETGTVPASWFIDPLMNCLSKNYYVSLLSAAQLHGAAHQAPMVFQVMLEQPQKPIREKNLTVQFYVRSNAGSMPTVKIQSPTGYFFCATPETTAFDLIGYANRIAGLNNVATVLSELREVLDAEKLLKLTTFSPKTWTQRLGFMLDFLDAQELTEGLFEMVEQWRVTPTALNPSTLTKGAPRDGKWNVIVNQKLEPDI